MGEKRDTAHGFGDPASPERRGSTPSAPGSAPAPAHGQAQAHPPQASHAPSPLASAIRPSFPAEDPVFDVDVTREIGEPGLLDGPWSALEIWTRNRIYALGADFTCVDVRDRQTGRSDPNHATLGARLVGGQLRDSRGLIIQVSHPFPEVGSAAVFATGIGNRLRVSETSRVTRVLFRQRIVRVGPNGELPSWDELTDPTPTYR